MRAKTGGVVHVASFIEEDLLDRDTGLYKPHIEALSDLADLSQCKYGGVDVGFAASKL